MVADQVQIGQVIMNLCTNAVQAMGNVGTLELGLRGVTVMPLSRTRSSPESAGRYIRLSVKDDGPGIDPRDIDRIFDPYFTTKDVGEGTGLGLTVVDSVVRRHGGSVVVDSQLGKGTTFHVYLPLSEAATDRDTGGPESLPTGTEKILFLDDEEKLVRTYSKIMSDLGYNVIPCTSCRHALEVFEKESDRIDLVITDMTMPEMTGDLLAREMQKTRADIPIIICTGHSERIAESTAKELGIAGYALKPIAKRDIAVAIRKALDGQR